MWAADYHYSLARKACAIVGIKSWPNVAYGAKDADYRFPAVDGRYVGIHFNYPKPGWWYKQFSWVYRVSDSRHKYAYSQLHKAREAWPRNRGKTLVHLGWGVHAIQDVFAHGDLDPSWHQVASLTGRFWAKHADDPAYRPWRAQKALEYSVRYFRHAVQQIPQVKG